MEATEDLIGNKRADKIISAGKTKNNGKEKEGETNEIQEILYITRKFDAYWNFNIVFKKLQTY